MAHIPSPTGLWDESPTSAMALTRMVWRLSGGAWDLVSDPSLESGKLVLSGGAYDFVTPASAVTTGATLLVGALRPGGTILVY